MTQLQELIKTADNLYYATEYDKAIELYRQALKLDPDNKHAQEEITKAEFYRSFKSVKPEDLMAEALQLYKRSRSFIAIGDLDGAKTLLQNSINIAEKAGVDFTNAKTLLENIQDASRAAEYKKKAFEDLEEQQWVKAEADLSIAIDLDPTDHIVQTLLPYLRSLLKAQNLALQLQAGFGNPQDRLRIDKEIQEILESTNDVPLLAALWLQVLEARNQKPVQSKEIGVSAQKEDMGYQRELPGEQDNFSTSPDPATLGDTSQAEGLNPKKDNFSIPDSIAGLISVLISLAVLIGGLSAAYDVSVGIIFSLLLLTVAILVFFYNVFKINKRGG